MANKLTENFIYIRFIFVFDVFYAHWNVIIQLIAKEMSQNMYLTEEVDQYSNVIHKARWSDCLIILEDNGIFGQMYWCSFPGGPLLILFLGTVIGHFMAQDHKRPLNVYN